MISNQKSLHTLRFLSDLVILNVSFLSAAILAQSWETLLFRNNMFILLLILNIIWKPLAASFKLYDEFIIRVPTASLYNIFKMILVQAILSVFFIFIYREGLFTRVFIIEFSILLFVLLSLKLYSFRKILKILRKRGINVRNLAILGGDEAGYRLGSLIEQNPQLGFKLLRLFDKKEIADNLEDVVKVITENRIEIILIALPAVETDLIKRILRMADKLAVDCYLVPDYSQFLINKFEINYFGDFPIISFRKNALDEIQYKFIKRVFDIVLSAIFMIIIGWWLFPVIMLLIKIDSKGPALFVQERVGYKTHNFRLYKFRTMTLAASIDISSAKPTTGDDDRVTKVGRYLRRSNFDELPQILNILIGNMSIVGPRPHPIPFDKMYSDMVEEIKLRYRVKPGLTGWAQIHGFRGDAIDPDENKKRMIERINYDNWYIENWSLWLDIQIILSTFWQMIQRKNKGN